MAASRTAALRAACLAVACVTAALSGAAGAADAPPPARSGAGVPVRLGDVEIFRFREWDGPFNPEERAELAERRLLRMAQDPFFDKDLLRVEPSAEGARILYRDALIGRVTEEQARVRGTTTIALADELVERAVVAIERYRAAHAPKEWERALVLLAASGAGLVLFLAGLARAHRSLDARLAAAAEAGRDVRLGRRWFARIDTVRAAERSLLRAVRAGATVLAVLVFLQISFAAVPLTRGYALALLRYTLDPIEALWDSFVAHVGDFFFIAVMLVLTHYVLRILRELFRAAARGAVSIPAVPQPWAMHIYRIVRIGVLGLLAVMLYPYIPGSSTDAFKGLGIFAGALFTLGASGAAGNVIGGLVLVFSNSFRVGDRVRIGDVTGDVVETTFTMTRLRTPRNEMVMVPNGLAMSELFVNYSARARESGLILHTSVSIGYDVPWRRVHELLVQAALSTQDILENPRPFVLQRELGDFSVTYEINAYTHDAQRMAPIYGRLHEAIQDAFRDAGVEILSPRYASLRDGNRSTVPPPEPPEPAEPPAADPDDPPPA